MKSLILLLVLICSNCFGEIYVHTQKYTIFKEVSHAEDFINGLKNRNEIQNIEIKTPEKGSDYFKISWEYSTTVRY